MPRQQCVNEKEKISPFSYIYVSSLSLGKTLVTLTLITFDKWIDIWVWCLIIDYPKRTHKHWISTDKITLRNTSSARTYTLKYILCKYIQKSCAAFRFCCSVSIFAAQDSVEFLNIVSLRPKIHRYWRNATDRYTYSESGVGTFTRPVLMNECWTLDKVDNLYSGTRI